QEMTMNYLKRDTWVSDRERVFAKLARRISRGLDAIYHGTRAPVEVLRSGKLKPDPTGKISFSRSPEVAAYFAHLQGDPWWLPALLVLNRSSLIQTYRLDPWRYGEDWVDEQEEVVWGRTINFRRHLLGVVTESDVNKILGPRTPTFYVRPATKPFEKAATTKLDVSQGAKETDLTAQPNSLPSAAHRHGVPFS